MIIYIASYPRSGNSLLQQTISTFFQRPMTVVYGGSKKPDYYRSGKVTFIKNFRLPKSSEFPRQVIEKISTLLSGSASVSLDKYIAFYDLGVSPFTKKCKYLMPGCLDILSPDNRKELANDTSFFFIKTHELPFEEYYDGEYALQPIRHPGAVLWSYKLYLKNFHGQDKTLEEVIAGNVPFGSWSKWHYSWIKNPKISMRLGDNHLLLPYEETLKNRLQTCEKIKNLIGLDYCKDKEILDFEAIQDGKHIREGSPDSWKKHYNSQQLSMLFELHGSMMKELGYFS